MYIYMYIYIYIYNVSSSPATVSWSNLIDYISLFTFHLLACRYI